MKNTEKPKKYTEKSPYNLTALKFCKKGLTYISDQGGVNTHHRISPTDKR